MPGRFAGTPAGAESLVDDQNRGRRHDLSSLAQDERVALHRTVGAELRRLRLNSGRSRRDVSRTVHIDQTYLRQLELGQAPRPEAGDVLILSEFYGVDWLDVFVPMYEEALQQLGKDVPRKFREKSDWIAIAAIYLFVGMAVTSLPFARWCCSKPLECKCAKDCRCKCAGCHLEPEQHSELLRSFTALSHADDCAP
ncbi:hypothetical protein Lesp02_30770 [Lentzea sp. NBRC 105346]|nr:helix-turn-helix transcriptional regulator [Lentzea sp. NBRC 105346]GLZ30888.1 hypothetical protein Lesp02_30770 [Lentzea sp. NBRC 105346]